MSNQETPEETIKRLTQENKDLVKNIEVLTGQVNKAKTDFTKLEEIHNGVKSELETLKTTHDELTTAHEQVVRESTEEIGRLSAAITAKPEITGGSPVVTVGGNKYRVIGKQFNLGDRGVIKVEDLIQNKDLLKELVELEVGFLVPENQNV